MEIALSESELASARSALLDSKSDDLIELVFRLNLSLPTEHCPADAWRTASELGWIGPTSPTLTDLGKLVADPLREYRFWLERDRYLHSERDYSLLARESYAGKTVVEVGCGFGCNLFSLSRMPGLFLGVEPVLLYRQFTPILAERESLECPQVLAGSGESIPFDDGFADIVLCYSAHQYMDIGRAIKEMARVLKPGGQLRIIGGTLAQYLSPEILKRFFRGGRLSNAGAYGLTIVNTFMYQIFERRLVVPRGLSTTTAPVYPTARAMARWFRRAGLTYRAELSRPLRGDTCFIAEKPNQGVAVR